MNKRLQIIAWCVFAAGVVIGCKGGDEADKKAKAEQLKGMLEGEKPPAEGDVSTCTGKYAGTCLTLGVHYQKGDGGKEKDVQKALTLFERTCDGGDDMRGCSLAAHLYKQGDDGVAKDESKALALYEIGPPSPEVRN